MNVEQRHLPECLLRASALIDGHVNRLALDSERPLDDLDRCLSSFVDTCSTMADVCKLLRQRLMMGTMTNSDLVYGMQGGLARQLLLRQPVQGWAGHLGGTR